MAINTIIVNDASAITNKATIGLVLPIFMSNKTAKECGSEHNISYIPPVPTATKNKI